MIRNDFLCLGKQCRTSEGATLYADLPSTSTRCPVCGSKRFQKIMACNVATGGVAKHVDGMLEHSGLREQLEARDRSRAAEQKDAHDRSRPGDAVVAGLAGNMGALVAKATAPWAGNTFAGASAGPNKAATLGQPVVLGQPTPRGGLAVAGTPLKLAGGPRPGPDSKSDGQGRPRIGGA